MRLQGSCDLSALLSGSMTLQAKCSSYAFPEFSSVEMPRRRQLDGAVKVRRVFAKVHCRYAQCSLYLYLTIT